MLMPTLIACLSTGKGTWAEVSRLINVKSWDKVFLITNQFGREKFTPLTNTQLIVINTDQDLSSLVKTIKENLKDKITDFEIALNFVSGAGKEHMALLEAVLELGFNFRLVTMKNNQLEVMGMERNQ